MAAAAFDLACLILCWLLGRRLGGATLGLLLAYLWAAYPFTLLTLASGANDALVAALVLAALLVASRPLARGGVIALAGLTKFAPLALAPLLATYERGRRGAVLTLLAVLVTTALVLAPFDLGGFWDRTLGFQSGRGSPFSIWGLWGLGLASAARAARCRGVGCGARLRASAARPRDVVRAGRGGARSRSRSGSGTGSICTSCGSCRLVWAAVLAPANVNGSR